jgi:hypothetical protein
MKGWDGPACPVGIDTDVEPYRLTGRIKVGMDYAATEGLKGDCCKGNTRPREVGMAWDACWESK